MARMLPTRRSVRVSGHDYSKGTYFVTICIHERKCVLGSVADGSLRLSGVGRFVSGSWESLPSRVDGVKCDDFVVMPNHLHGLLELSSQSPLHRRRDIRAGIVVETPITLGEVVRRFKSNTSREIHERGMIQFQWQRGLFEHIVPDDEDLARIREYIARNPEEWEHDRENPQYKPAHRTLM